MPRAFYPRDFDLLGYEPLQAKGIELDTVSYSVFNVTARAGLDSVPAKFVYVKAACTADDAKKAGAYANSHPNTFVVYSRTAGERLPVLRQSAGEGSRFFLIDDLIWQKVRAEFAVYLLSLQEGIQTPDPYITPRPVSNPNASLKDMMLDWLRESESKASPQIRVIRAPAGVGKTSLARQLTRRLALK